jgi:multidrug efflux pump subunit AcrA (membrane-fusion protein)
MTENERDIIALLDALTENKPLTDRLAAARQRLLAQMPTPAAIDEMKQEAERARQMAERRKKALGPPNPVNRGMVMPPPSAEEIVARQAEMRRLREIAERNKRPFQMPTKAVT